MYQRIYGGINFKTDIHWALGRQENGCMGSIWMLFKVGESSSGTIPHFFSSTQSFSTLRLASSNELIFSLPLCRVKKQNSVFLKNIHQPKRGSQWWVLIIPWCALSGAYRQRFRDKQGLGNITIDFYPNQGIFFLNIWIGNFSWVYFSFLFSFFFLFTMVWLLLIKLPRYPLSKKTDPC